MLSVDENEEDVGVDIRNDGTEVKVVVGKWVRDRERGILKKRYLALGFHNGMLQVLPTLWEFPKMSVKQLIEN